MIVLAAMPSAPRMDSSVLFVTKFTRLKEMLLMNCEKPDFRV